MQNTAVDLLPGASGKDNLKKTTVHANRNREYESKWKSVSRTHQKPSQTSNTTSATKNVHLGRHHVRPTLLDPAPKNKVGDRQGFRSPGKGSALQPPQATNWPLQNTEYIQDI